MLVEILCKKFRQNRVIFYPGLNVVLGDNVASNSIGKSTMLMVIDFVYGGDTFRKSHIDVIKELGHHDYCFQLEFDKQKYYFKRTTNDPDVVHRCSSNYTPIEVISKQRYTDFLLRKYELENVQLSFRSIVSLFSRIWKKENLNVKKPLASFDGQAAYVAIDYILKIYLKYESLLALSNKLDVEKKRKDAINGAINNKLLPSITKKQYKENARVISQIEQELKLIAEKLSQHVTNVQEVINREVLDLTEAKDALLKEKLLLKSRLGRLKKNLEKKRKLKNSELYGLTAFFPDINLERLQSVDEFHSGITQILKKEMHQAEKELISNLERVTFQIDSIDKEIKSRVTQIKNPAVIVDRIYKITKKSDVLERQNSCYDEKYEIKSKVKELSAELSENKKLLLSEVAEEVNSTIKDISTEIYEEERKTPAISFGDNTYQYEIIDDTGTGTAYLNLLLLDLAVFRNTLLPFLIHDSLLFKNIGNESVGRLMMIYNNQKKQSFIAIDEIEKYGKRVEELLYDKCVLKLDAINVLYIKNWKNSNGS